MSELEVAKLVSNWRSEFRRGALQLYLLSLIENNQEKEMYGYEIVNELKKRTGYIFDIKEGVLYPILRRLSDDGLLESEWKFPIKGVSGLPKPRKYYRLTKRGYQVLDEITLFWKDLTREMDLILNVEDE